MCLSRCRKIEEDHSNYAGLVQEQTNFLKKENFAVSIRNGVYNMLEIGVLVFWFALCKNKIQFCLYKRNLVCFFISLLKKK